MNEAQSAVWLFPVKPDLRLSWSFSCCVLVNSVISLDTTHLMDVWALVCVCVFIVVYSFQLLNESLCSWAAEDGPSCWVIWWKKSDMYKSQIDAGTHKMFSHIFTVCVCSAAMPQFVQYGWAHLVFSRPSGLCLSQRITRLLHSLADNKFPICGGAYFVWNKI